MASARAASAWAAVATISASTSAPSAASRALAAASPPASASRRAASALTSKPRTAWPARTRLRAIGSPMAPSPTKPIRLPPSLTTVLPLVLRRKLAREARAGKRYRQTAQRIPLR